jgi:hypothetical protein
MIFLECDARQFFVKPSEYSKVRQELGLYLDNLRLSFETTAEVIRELEKLEQEKENAKLRLGCAGIRRLTKAEVEAIDERHIYIGKREIDLPKPKSEFVRITLKGIK